jgi:hypothetical protein
MGKGHNISVIYIYIYIYISHIKYTLNYLPSETREILSADVLGTRSGTITSEDSTHKLYLVANSLQSGYNRSSIYIRLRKDIYPSKVVFAMVFFVLWTVSLDCPFLIFLLVDNLHLYDFKH